LGKHARNPRKEKGGNKKTRKKQKPLRRGGLIRGFVERKRASDRKKRTETQGSQGRKTKKGGTERGERRNRQPKETPSITYDQVKRIKDRGGE